MRGERGGAVSQTRNGNGGKGIKRQKEVRGSFLPKKPQLFTFKSTFKTFFFMSLCACVQYRESICPTLFRRCRRRCPPPQKFLLYVLAERQ